MPRTQPDSTGTAYDLEAYGAGILSRQTDSPMWVNMYSFPPRGSIARQPSVVTASLTAEQVLEWARYLHERAVGVLTTAEVGPDPADFLDEYDYDSEGYSPEDEAYAEGDVSTPIAGLGTASASHITFTPQYIINTPTTFRSVTVDDTTFPSFISSWDSIITEDRS